MDASVERSGILASAPLWAPDTGIHPCKEQGDNCLPPTCGREMKGFAESFELRGGNELESQQM